MAKLISLGKRNKSLLFLIIMSISSVLNIYIYGFSYINCFYPINIYKSLYNWIIDKNKTDFPHHRVFDPLFSYVGVIFLTLFFVKDNDKYSEGKSSEDEKLLKINFILRRKKEYLKNIKVYLIIYL